MPRVRRAADPHDLNTITENYHLSPAVEQRLALGGWTAVHVRRMGDRATQNATGRPLRTLATVPRSAAWGWPDWVCLHDAEPAPLILELKSEIGQLTDEQVVWLTKWQRAGAHIAVVRPRDVFVGIPDALFIRLVEHRLDAPAWSRAESEAVAAVKAGIGPSAVAMRRILSRAKL